MNKLNMCLNILAPDPSFVCKGSYYIFFPTEHFPAFGKFGFFLFEGKKDCLTLRPEDSLLKWKSSV